ncbi:MAG: MATE family efflux transporter [Holosporaceae bacterium]|jgi:MATE family multidrug resistance protein|nr:MATE family efflux transporter [Holosporaceae bacterium]
MNFDPKVEHKALDCSWKSVWGVTIPLMFSMLSHFLMLLIDRSMLAAYSMDSMNAATMSGNFVCIFVFMFTGITSTAVIFVGRYNGAGYHEKLSAPIWQMIYMSLLTCVISIPVAYFSDYINILPDCYRKEGVEYQKTLMYFSITAPIRSSLSAFFVGQGKTKVITFVVSVGVILNIALDYVFIFGINGIVPPMGCKGAAIATVIAEFIQIIVLAALFFSRKNRRIYKTFENRQVNVELFLGCIRIGLPIALGNVLSMITWNVIQSAVCHVSTDMATIYNIGMNVYTFFLFAAEGADKAVATICSNMIGRGDLDSVEKIRRIFVSISIFFGAVVAVPLIMYPEWLFRVLSSFSGNISNLYEDIRQVLPLVALNVTLETLVYSQWGILTAGGDSKYAVISLQICQWVFVAFPTLLLYQLDAITHVQPIFLLIAISLTTTWLLIYRRYRGMQWLTDIEKKYS